MTPSMRSPRRSTRQRVRWTTPPARSRSASAPRACSRSARCDRSVSSPFRAIAIVTAAGSAERFGGRKLLAPVDGEPLLDRTIRSLLHGGVADVIVVVGTDGRAELERDVNAMNDARVRPVENPDPSRGMFSSIQEGLATASGDVLLVMPGDMPFVRPVTVHAVIAKYTERNGIVSPRYLGQRRHPVAMSLALRDQI